MSLMVTGLYASLTGLLIVALAYRVVKLRRGQKIGLGDGGNSALALANRVHVNLIENAPIVLILMLVAEAGGLSAFYLHCFGTVWIVARLLHAIGLTQGQGGYHFGRFWGVLLTWLVIISLALVNLLHFAQGLGKGL
ncbi:MAPEG family protein [Shewanella sp. NKUCC05_KAH]|uniref:MAPEG family protein n=1 Tax=Shewanella TaxID=22 RepID=UPI001C5AF5C9|nr:MULTISPECIES: MAPEG family protein [unclassified Shewanella]MBW3527164.1 MAPEG family protein [Shewanella sp. NKUCC05_KAH]MBW3532645.1 MAPEG family protein [Shewanella sp. NKUCC06_TVS]MCU7986788.1 MAPEG family protein [Shewanella sp. SW24]